MARLVSASSFSLLGHQDTSRKSLRNTVSPVVVTNISCVPHLQICSWHVGNGSVFVYLLIDCMDR